MVYIVYSIPWCNDAPSDFYEGYDAIWDMRAFEKYNDAKKYFNNNIKCLGRNEKIVYECEKKYPNNYKLKEFLNVAYISTITDNFVVPDSPYLHEINGCAWIIRKLKIN